jgi:hypothetical protein
VGGLLGRVALAVLALVILSRRWLFRVFQIPALIFVPLFFWWVSKSLQGENLALIKWGMLAAGFLTVAQFSFWGNYIPLVFPLHLRGTGEGFAANIGGRILGTMAAWITLTLGAVPRGSTNGPAKLAMMGAIVAGSYALIGTLLTFFLPEPRHGEFDEDHAQGGRAPVAGEEAAAAVGQPTQVMEHGPKP